MPGRETGFAHLVLLMNIFFRGAVVAMGSGNNRLRKGDDMLPSANEEGRSRCETLRSGLITEVQRSTGFQNLAETRSFHSAVFLSDTVDSSEPVVFLACDALKYQFIQGQAAVKRSFSSV
ncbi:MAG: hypothetical protein KDA77_08630 [Planctomycetaceae bacterium]|nr:hypothetical protein [Planctomycetaceae bacterium]